VAAFGSSGPEGRFHVGLAALAVSAATYAYVGLTLRQATAALAFGAVLMAGLLLATGASLGAACAGAALVTAVGLAAQGFASLGRSLGTGAVASGACACALLVAGLTGLVWADPVAEGLPRPSRWPFRQAVLHLDAATAFAYDAARFDRLLHAPVYASVPLASTSIEKPGAERTAAIWGAFGLLAGAAGWGVARFKGAGARGP
jgi:hypothetical protein